MFQWLQGLVGGNNGVADAAMAAEVPMTMPFPVAAETTETTAAADDGFSNTLEAEKALGSLFTKQMVMRDGPTGTKDSVPLPVAGVQIVEGSPYGAEVDGVYLGNTDVDPALKGDPVRIKVKLRTAGTDYDKASLNAAFHRVLDGIPALKGKIDPHAAHVKPVTYSDVWNELKPMLEKRHEKVTVKELAIIGEFFEAKKGEHDEAREWGRAVQATHSAGKVHFAIEAKELAKDKEHKSVESTDTKVIDGLKELEAPLLAKFKEHVLSLKKPDGTPLLAATDLDKLEMHIEATGYNIAIDFGTKAEHDTDPLDHHKLTDVERNQKMTETALAKIDTTQLEATFVQSLLECHKELPPITSRIMDSHMLADVLRKRFHNDPEITKLIAEHPMFKPADQVKLEVENKLKNGVVTLPTVEVGKDNNEKPEVTLDFTLPHGMKLSDFLTSVRETPLTTALAAGMIPGTAFSLN